MTCLLEANDIPYFVRGGAMASLNLAANDMPTILVPQSLESQARDLLATFAQPLPVTSPVITRPRGFWRFVKEILFGAPRSW